MHITSWDTSTLPRIIPKENFVSHGEWGSVLYSARGGPRNLGKWEFGNWLLDALNGALGHASGYSYDIKQGE
jgi:hypothetical protein